MDEFGAVSPDAVGRVGLGNASGLARIPSILGEPRLLRRRFGTKGRQGWTAHELTLSRSSAPIINHRPSYAVRQPMSALGQKRTSAFNKFIGSQYQPSWDLVLKCVGSLEIDDELEPGWLFDGDVSGFDASQNLRDLPADEVAIDLDDARSISEETFVLGHLRPLINRR